MTTAHKPTWNPARATENGGFLASGPSMSYSSRDVPAHTKLKFRSDVGSSADLREKLEEKERAHLKEYKRSRGEEMDTDLIEDDRAKRRKITSGASISEDEGSVSEEERLPVQEKARPAGQRNIDADDSSGSESSDSESSSDDESGDEMAELERELEKIKRERKEEAERKQREREAAEAAQAEREALLSNPLLAAQTAESEGGDYTIRKKWWEDTVFRNQAKGEPQFKKRFINDTLRNDFHKRFLNKYIK